MSTSPKATTIPSPTAHGPKPLELLAPARDLSTAIAAIDHGADAVYIGAPSFGARRQASNSLDDIRKVVDYAHQFGVRVYVTVNVIVYESELRQVEALVWDLWRTGVDALIVQDLGITRLNLPPIALHASTQCDTRDTAKAKWLEQLGFTRIVLARELTLKEIENIHQEVKADLEVFAHGALCVSYSGDCQASYIITGRSANRGECCQVCRFRFDLEDKDGNKIITGKHLLSLKDMNRLSQLEAMADAGVTSFKIEGRLKDETYVKNVVAAYSRQLDAIVAANPGKFCRSSRGRVDYDFEPSLSKSFNRGFTDYFLSGRQPKASTLASHDSPKSIGEVIGKVLSSRGNTLVILSEQPLGNGDGLGYFDAAGEFAGFRVNSAKSIGNGKWEVTALNHVPVAKGTQLYRNFDKKWEDRMAAQTASRTIPTKGSLQYHDGKLSYQFGDDNCSVTVVETIDLQEARSPQFERRFNEMNKLGNTPYRLQHLEDKAGDLFVPASILSVLRRRAVEMYQVAQRANYIREKPGKPAAEIKVPEGSTLTRHDNIANSVSRGLYSQITGIAQEEIPMAAEVQAPHDKEIQVMECRYCLRRELGACLKTSEGKRLTSPLFLTSQGNRFRLDFDCRNCNMRVVKI